MVQWQKWKGFLILWWHRNDCQPKGRTSLWLRRMERSPPSMCGDLPAWYPSNTLFHQITFLINVATHPFNTLTPTNLEARDLEVNGGVWRGETTDVGYDTFPSGWGILQYNEADHLNRFWSNWEKRFSKRPMSREKYDGTMAVGVMEGYGNLFWKDGSHYSGQVKDIIIGLQGWLF